jgi:hypothetical protein
MDRFIGNKEILAVPMTRAAYNELRGWNVPKDENPADEGYLVEYIDGGPPNVEGYAGYVSWSPKSVFEKAYRRVDCLPFSLALEAVMRGKLARRRGWNGKGMYIYLVDGSRFTVNRAPLNRIMPEGTTVNYRPHLDMRTAQGDNVPWVASQSDLLSCDWEVLNSHMAATEPQRMDVRQRMPSLDPAEPESRGR